MDKKYTILDKFYLLPYFLFVIILKNKHFFRDFLLGGTIDMIRLLLADESILIREALKSYFQDISYVEIVGEVDNGIDLIKCTKDVQPNVIIVEIEIPKMNGIEAAKYINAISPNIIFIFISSKELFIKEAFNIYAYDYILKPLQYQRILKTIDRINHLDKHKLTPKIPEVNSKLLIESVGKIHLINIQDIIYITRYDRKVSIICKNGKFSAWTSIEKIEKKLPEYFFRSHKGYIINTSLIKEILIFGKRTYQVYFHMCKETALITSEKVKILKEKYLI